MATEAMEFRLGNFKHLKPARPLPSLRPMPRRMPNLLRLRARTRKQLAMPLRFSDVFASLHPSNLIAQPTIQFNVRFLRWSARKIISLLTASTGSARSGEAPIALASSDTLHIAVLTRFLCRIQLVSTVSLTPNSRHATIRRLDEMNARAHPVWKVGINPLRDRRIGE